MEGPIFSRRSVREYKPDKVDKETLEKVLKAGCYAPSAMGKDVARFVVVNHNENAVTKRISDSVLEKIPQFKIPDIFYGSPHVIFVFVEDSWNNCEELDGGLIVQNILLHAAEMKLGTVVVGCTKSFAPMIKKELNVTNDKWHFVVAIPIGHPANEDDLHVKDKPELKVTYM